MNMVFQQAVKQYSGTLYRLSFSYCGNAPDAEDVLQETFLRYLRCQPEFETPEKLRAWLMTVTANLSRDLLRKRRRQAPLTEAETIAAPETEPDYDVRRAILALPVSYRGVVYLYYYEQYSVRQIAQMLHLSETAVRSRLHRARRQLEKYLGGTQSNG